MTGRAKKPKTVALPEGVIANMKAINENLVSLEKDYARSRNELVNRKNLIFSTAIQVLGLKGNYRLNEKFEMVEVVEDAPLGQPSS